jgi:gluconolactonase
MKRILSLMLVLPLTAYAVTACSKQSSDDEANTPGTGGGDNGGGGGGANGGGDGTPKPTEDELKKNPIEGVAPPKAVFEAGAFTDGPVWHAKLGVLFFSTPLGEGAIYRMLPDGRAMKVRDGVRAQGTTPVGNTINEAGEIITVEIKRISKFGFDEKNMPLAPTVIATGYAPGAAPPPPATPPDPANPTPPPTSAPGQFDTLNDVAVNKDGTLYVTDPGFFETPQANRIYRVAPDGTVQVVEAFEDVPRPNGIAMSADGKNLYVGFTAPIKGTLPFIRQYIVNPDGTLGEWTKFVDIGPEDSEPDGIAVDMAGNVYVATKAGIEVYKSDSTKVGVVAMPPEEKPTGITFGGKDMKSLYITTEGVKIWELRLNVPGISQ